ncbi:AlpA family phage regulatory protein [Psychrobacter immobilis]|uniref:helix-turn-helix transcriptional regulator n=2 Tax=Moraxellaceae TaxID=468 RepID=UPI0018F5E1FB|nr:AlpA family phage regulatory protein [Psychrobacter immobilis]
MYDQYKHNDCNESLKNELISTLPVQGMSRAKTILPFLPFSRTTLHEWSRDGRFPASIRLSPTVVAWRNSEVLAWIESHSTSSNDKEA